MPKVFKVEKAFLSTEADKKTPQVVNTKGGEMHKFMVQFENQSIPGWVGILKKPGNVVNEGDEMYGVLEENQWGKPQFTRMQLPQDGSIQLKTSAPASQGGALPATSTSTGSTGGVDEELHAKVDFLIDLVEKLLESQGTTAPERPTSNQNTEDDDTKPLDLSEIPY